MVLFEERIDLGDYSLKIVDDPNFISGGKREKFIDDCLIVTRRGFGNPDITRSDVETHALDATTSVYLEYLGKIIAFSSSVLEEIKGENVLHVKGAVIDPSYQGKGIYNFLAPVRLLREVEKFKKSFYVGTRTQNPRVFEFFSKKIGLNPQIGEKIPFEIQELGGIYAKYVQEKHSDFIPRDGLIFDKENFIVRNAYGFVDDSGEEKHFSMYGKNIPLAKDPKINEYIKNNLNFENGDAFILFGNFCLGKTLDCLNSSLMLDPEKKIYSRFKNSLVNKLR